MRSNEWNIIKKGIDLDAVENDLGITVLRNGREDVAHCPLPTHPGNDANPSFAINRDKLVYNCFACGLGGSLVDLVSRIEDIGWDEALEWLKAHGKTVLDADPEAFLASVERMLYFTAETGATRDSLPLYATSVLDKFHVHETDYWAGRNISPESERHFRLGYDPAYTKFNPKTGAEYTGKAAIIPHFFEEVLVGYQARWLEGKPEGLPRFDNTKNFPKATTLFNFDIHQSATQAIYVVESPISVCILHSMGRPAVATFGASISDEQINLLRMLGNIILAFDNDTPGYQASAKVIQALQYSTSVWCVAPLEEEKSNVTDLSKESMEVALTTQFPGILWDLYMKERV